MDFPNELLYTKTHEWIRKNDDGTAVIGITEYASKALGDIVYIEFETGVDEEISKQASYCTIESVKAVESSYMPITGTILEINDSLEDDYSVMSTSPYEKGWLIKIKINNPDEISGLLDVTAYTEVVKEAEKQ
ncbi:MAG: glycine cleavage system protein GcvH [archaeon]|nr:glycine cleavage system protein GcvH [archaeon]